MVSDNVISEEHQQILTKGSFGHVATVGPKGEPHSSPVWVDYDGEHVRFSQTTTRQKLRNLRQNPRVAVSATDPDNPYHYVEVRGVVDDVADDVDNAFIDAMAKRYMGKDTYPFHQPGDKRVVVKVRPTHTTSMGS